MIDSITAEIIAKKYYKTVYAYCLSYVNCNESDACDITQEVFLLFQRKCEALDNVNIRSWLYKATRYKVQEHYRKTKKDDRLVPLDENTVSADEDELVPIFEEQFNMKDEEIEKYKAIVLKGLTKSEQELYNKIFIEKKKYKEIAEELNISVKGVNSRAMRLRIKIRRAVTLMFTSVGQLVIKLFF